MFQSLPLLFGEVPSGLVRTEHEIAIRWQVMFLGKDVGQGAYPVVSKQMRCG